MATPNATGRNAPLVVHPEVAGTLCASGAGLSRPAGMASETDLCVAIDYRASVTPQSKSGDGHPLNYINPVRTGHTVRRLTPVECERLQNFPDDWTAYGANGKPISDSKRYSMLGNSVATPCVEFVLGNIAQNLIKEGEGAICI